MKRRMALAVMVAVAMAGGCAADRPASPLVRSTSARSEPVASRAVEPDGGVGAPHVVGLPPEGIAVEEGDAVLLLSVGGEVLHHLEGFAIVSSLPGDVVLRRRHGDLWAVDAARGALVRRTSAYGTPLANGHRLLQGEDHSTVLRFGDVAIVGADSSGLRVSYDRDVVTVGRTTGVVAHDLRTGEQRRLPDGCHVADRHGRAWYLACYSASPEGEDPRIERLPGGARIDLGPDDHGMWQSFMVSPDGREFVGTIGYDCAGPKVVAGSTSGGTVRSLGAIVGAAEEPDAAAIGWTSGGAAVFEASGNCGGPLQGLGVYALEGDRTRAVYLPPDPHDEWLTTAMWTPLPGDER